MSRAWLSSALVLLAVVPSAAISGPRTAHAEAPRRSPTPVLSPVGPELLSLLPSRGTKLFAPDSRRVGALVAVPSGSRAKDLGLEEVSPGIARLRGTPDEVLAFSAAHPSVRVELGSTLHLLMNSAGGLVGSRVANTRGVTGEGVYLGVADTGLDVAHADFRNPDGTTRVAWLLDLSREVLGLHPDVEAKFSATQGSTRIGAVFSRADIDAVLKKGEGAPEDRVGHGTHVTGIAAASGGAGVDYAGVAPKADLVIVRLTRNSSQAIENDDLVRAVQFMFDRADADKRPIAVNLSLGSDFGSHDGLMLWEQAIASFVGPDKPGHVIVAAAGNSGSSVTAPIHQSVFVPDGSKTKVPVVSPGAVDGSVQIWVALRRNADLQIGLEGPDGEWVPPIASGQSAGKRGGTYEAGVVYGAGPSQGQIPEGSRSGVVVWTGAYPPGTYNVVLEGRGMADLYLQSVGDATGLLGTSFVNGVREGTINLPATHPSILGVGCTVNHPNWTSVGGVVVNVQVPVADEAGGFLLRDDNGRPRTRRLSEGEMCWFSSAGPTVSGVAKPEISAPGGVVIASMSQQALPGEPSSIFTSGGCPDRANAKEGLGDACFAVDDQHAVSVGTSMASPMVAGAAALLLQRDPTLTQDKVTALLQGGAHRFRGNVPFYDQSGAGELDVLGALDALSLLQTPQDRLPDAGQSWITVSTDYVPADGALDVTAIVELRTATAAVADFFDPTRLEALVTIDGDPVPATIQRRGPGVWTYVLSVPPSSGGKRATFGARFDGVAIVAAKTLPIATDGWNARYPSSVTGGCSFVAGPGILGGDAVATAVVLLGLVLVRRRRAV